MRHQVFILAVVDSREQSVKRENATRDYTIQQSALGMIEPQLRESRRESSVFLGEFLKPV